MKPRHFMAAITWVLVFAIHVHAEPSEVIVGSELDSKYFSVGYPYNDRDEEMGLTDSTEYSCMSDSCGHCSHCCCRTVPNMLGDSLDVPVVFGFFAGDQIGIARHYAKVADNNNVLPQSRIAFSYNLYANVPKTWSRPGGNVLTQADISEFKLHFEKAFCDGDWSLNLMLPFYHTISFSQSTFTGTTINGEEGGQFGNLAFGFKRVLRRREDHVVSGGLLLEAPTAQDYFAFGDTIVNDEWFLTPYLGLQYTPNDRWFAHGFASYRFRTGVNESLTVPTGFIQSERLMLDGALGYWMFRHDDCRQFMTGLAPTVELHYTTYTEDQDPLMFTSEWFNRVDLLNLTLGATAELVNGGTLATGIGIPLRQGRFPGGDLPTDRSMDWELLVQYNQRF